MLTSRLQHSFGISGTALMWIQSYLTNRTQFVQIGQSRSSSAVLSTGVPQGSVLGPIFFSSYISPIGRIVSNHNIQHQQYADDTQLFVSLTSLDVASSLSQLEACLLDLHHWLCQNGLCLNPSKSDAILFGNARRLASLPSITGVNIAGCYVPLADKITTLGVVLDRTLTMNFHVSSLYKTSYYHIRSLRHIRTSLPDDVCITLATALVQSRLDYCNSILYRTSAGNVNKLQRVQNALARTVYYRSPRMPSAVLVHNLHWLPVKSRVDFKIAVLTYKLLATHEPGYLHERLTCRPEPRTLRSTRLNLLQVPRTKTVHGDRAFSVAAPSIWNSIPLDIRTSSSVEIFRRKLKTHFFSLV